MTRHRILWRAETGSADVLLNDGMSDPFVVSLTPVVTADALGVRVGMLHRGHDSFGYWTSDRSTDPVTAWRTARVLTRVTELDVRGYRKGGNDIGAVADLFARNLDTEGKEFARASEILRMSFDSLDNLVVEMMNERPDGRTMYHLWNGMPDKLQDRHLDLLSLYVERYPQDVSDRLRQLLETVDLRVRTKEEQLAREDALVEAGIPSEAGIERFLQELGVLNLVYTDPGDFGPSHFGLREDGTTVDQQVLGLLIGRSGHSSEVRLLTTDLQPGDPKAYHVAGIPGGAMYSRDFGLPRPPAAMIGKDRFELMAATWDRVTERFLLRVRPAGLPEDDATQDVWRSIPDLRAVMTPIPAAGLFRRLLGGRST